MRLHRGDSPELVKRFILRDDFLRTTYSDTYELIKSDLLKKMKNELQDLRILELGGAGGISEISFPNIIKSDVVFSKDLNLICSASNLPFKDNTVDVMIMKDTFHHLPNISIFLKNAIKIMPVGSCMYIADPNWNVISQFVYKYLHPEPFDKSAKAWVTEASQPWHSNQALLWIVFKRDRKLFSTIFPNLIVEEIGFTSGISYILSGGVYSRNIISSNLLILLHRLEKRLNSALRFIAITKIIKITKT